MAAYESAPSRARRMLEHGCSIRDVCACTGLPESIVQRIAAPIQAIREAEKAMMDAERRISREQRRDENRRLRQLQPCPLCEVGHGILNNYVLATRVATPDGGVHPICADVNYCECSNPRCIAQLMYPRDTPEEALQAFMEGRFAEPCAFRDQNSGLRLLESEKSVDRRIKRLFDQWTPEQVKRLGFDPKRVDRLALEHALDRVKNDPDELDTTLMCPNCGRKGEYRKATNPLTHSKGGDCWWRVACRGCGTRLKHAFPTQEEAAQAFENGDIERNPMEGRKR